MKEKIKTIEQQAAPAAKPQAPDGMDEACYNQGWNDGAAQEYGAAAATNPFEAASNAGVSWQAGYDAYIASVTPEPPEIP